MDNFIEQEKKAIEKLYKDLIDLMIKTVELFPQIYKSSFSTSKDYIEVLKKDCADNLKEMSQEELWEEFFLTVREFESLIESFKNNDNENNNNL